MIFGKNIHAVGHLIKAAGLSLALMAVPAAAAAPAAVAPAAEASAAAAPVASDAAAPAVVATTAAAPVVVAPAAPVIDPNDPHFKVAPGGYTPMKPTEGKGMPVPGAIGLQTQYAPLGEYGQWMHDIVLMPIITVITLFVLALLLWVVVRYNKRANPVASKTSHNTLIEIVWTLVPVLILVAIAVPSIDLLGKQFKPAPEKALTIKATGYQWYWTYTYPDNGGFEVVSNMLSEEEAHAKGEPGHLAADYRMVVPAGEPIRMQITAADVIHAFAIPSLWFKLDAVPGRINEKVLFIKEPGVYYGQCSELCGVKHGYMPIAIEALPRDKFNAWVKTQADGKIDGMPEAPAAAAPAAAATPEPAVEASPAAAASASAAPAV